MPTKFEKLSYTTVYQEVPPIQADLVAAAAFATVAEFNVTPITTLTVTCAVAIAALTGVEVWVRGDSNGAWIRLDPRQLNGYGRSDSGTDINTTPVGASFFLQIDCSGWSDVRINAKSAGSADLFISAGGK